MRIHGCTNDAVIALSRYSERFQGKFGKKFARPDYRASGADRNTGLGWGLLINGRVHRQRGRFAGNDDRGGAMLSNSCLVNRAPSEDACEPIISDVPVLPAVKPSCQVSDKLKNGRSRQNSHRDRQYFERAEHRDFVQKDPTIILESLAFLPRQRTRR